MTKKPSIYDIKHDVENSKENCYFFSYKTLKFFGQTMKDFSVRKSPMGRIFIFATMYYDKNYSAGYTFREYKDHTLTTPYNDDGSEVKHGRYDLQEIFDFIQTH